MEYNFRSPTRVDFAGGTLDCWPLYLLLKPLGVEACRTVNLSISIETSAQLTPRSTPEVNIRILEQNYQKSFKNWTEVRDSQDPQIRLIQYVVDYWNPKEGFDLVVSSQSPIGAGLGGSSSLCVSLMKAFASWQGKKMNVYELVHICHNIEAQVLGTPTGTQDYFPAADPGLLAIKYDANGHEYEVIKSSLEFFDSQLILVYTGKPHNSGINNFKVIQEAVNGNKKVLQSLADLAGVADLVYQACRSENWSLLPDLFQKETQCRLALTPAFSCAEIEKLEKLVMNRGAQAIKICGAGGGGCVMVWADPKHRANLIDLCQKEGFKVLPARPVH